MNDFTKEELEDLYICCGSSIHSDHPLESWKKELQKKIQSLIDSYCEHSESIIDRDGGISLACKSCWETTLDV